MFSQLWCDAASQWQVSAKGAPEAIAQLCHLSPKRTLALLQAAEDLALGDHHSRPQPGRGGVGGTRSRLVNASISMTHPVKSSFLAAIHADRALQQALTQPELLDFAVRIARAAGYEVSSADLIPSPPGQAPRRFEERPAAEGLEIDFDGDGVPDAVMEGGRWILLDSED